VALFIRSIYWSSALSLAYIYLLYRSHPLRRIPTVPMMTVFVVGMLSVLPVVVVRRVLPLDVGALDPVFVAPLLEEAVKLAVFAAAIRRLRFPDVIEPLDIAVYLGVLGVGFGIYEDFSYVFAASAPSWTTGDVARFSEVFRWAVVARAFPGHILFNGIAGFFVGEGLLDPRRWRRLAGWIAGFAVAVAAHAAFNAVAATGAIPLLTYCVALVGAFLGLRQRAVSRSPFRALIRLAEGERVDWRHERSPVELLFAEGFDWPGTRRRGFFQFYPIALSLAVLFPLLVSGVYLLQRAIIAVTGG